MSSSADNRTSDIDAVRRLAGSGPVLWLGDVESPARRRLDVWLERLAVTESADEALGWLDDQEFSLVVVEATPEGFRFLEKIVETIPPIGVVAVSPRSETVIALARLGVCGIVLDLDELPGVMHQELVAAQKRQQESKYLSRLEEEIRLRTEELHEAQVQIVRLQEAKDNMLALISHEIRTPLNGILGFIDLLRSPEFSADAATFLVHVEESARRLERSTRKALDFASLSTGLRAVRSQRHRVPALLEAAREQLGQRGELPVAWEGPEHLDTDGELTVQIFRNLLENSAKYGGDAPEVSVSLVREGRWDVLSFRDNGPGFAPAVLPTLFQPFSTGGILHHSEGMGLGLALVDVIMLTLGGRAEAGNAREGGAVVKLRFPVKDR